MLKIYKSVRRAFPVTVISLKRHDGPLLGANLQSLRCTCCSDELGNRGWGLAWINDGSGNRGARLCFECTNEAAAALAESQATTANKAMVSTS
jgi:hypothetical protein